MPAGSVAVKERHQPRVLVETAGLSEEEWLAYRQKGIGGSDVAALLGISPWRTARDLFYDKLNIAVVEDHEDNWVALEMGHLLEPLVAKIFQHRTGYKIYQIKKMFQHPKYPWMLADVDYFVELPDGTTAILEIKTTNYNAKDNWWLDGEETMSPRDGITWPLWMWTAVFSAACMATTSRKALSVICREIWPMRMR